jgi:uncharacterized membrane protein
MDFVFLTLVVLLTLLFHFLPGWTRPDLFFAVTVEPSFPRTETGREIVRKYRIVVWLLGAAAIATGAFAGFAHGIDIATVLILIAATMPVLAWAHHKTLPWAATPSEVIEVDLAAPREDLPGGIAALVIPLAALAVLAVRVVLDPRSLPARFPVIWGIGKSLLWTEGTPRQALLFLAGHAALCSLMLLVAWGTLHWTRRVSTSGDRACAERSFRARCAEMLLIGAYLMAGQAFIALVDPSPLLMGLWTVIGAGAVATYVFVLARIGQGGSRLIAGSASGPPAGDRTPDRCWKWGLFYFNPADPSIFVEKRFGIGYTLNFGNLRSWALTALLIGVFIVVRILRP